MFKGECAEPSDFSHLSSSDRPCSTRFVTIAAKYYRRVLRVDMVLFFEHFVRERDRFGLRHFAPHSGSDFVEPEVCPGLEVQDDRLAMEGFREQHIRRLSALCVSKLIDIRPPCTTITALSLWLMCTRLRPQRDERTPWLM